MGRGDFLRPVALAALILLLAFIAGAQTLGPDDIQGKIGKDVEVRWLYPAGKFFDYESLFPVVLECQNISPTPQRFTLKWTLNQKIPEQYQSLTLEPGAKKRIPFLFPARTVGQLYSLQINQQSVDPGLSSASQGRVTGLLVSGDDTLDYLRSLQIEKNSYYNPSYNNEQEEYSTPAALSNIDAEVFPEHWGALESLQLLICYDPAGLGLGSTHYEAIVNWVRQGGDLVIVSNGLPGEYEGTPLEPLLPLQPEETGVVAGMVAVKGRMAPNATVLHGDESEPLLLKRRELNGNVFLITAPLLEPTLLGKGKTESLWRDVFALDDPNNQGHTQTHRIFTYSILDNMPELPRAQAGWLALFVILYGVIVGPVNLSILRKRDKMLWAFITVPVVAMLFAGGAYVVNRAIRPSQPLMREIGWLHLRNDSEVGVAESEQLLFSPYSADFTVTSGEAALFNIFQPNYGAFNERHFELYHLTPEGGLKSELNMGTWDIQRFNSQAVMTLDSPFSIQLDPDGKKVSIRSPLDSDGPTATISHPTLGVSEGFSLKRGTHDYDLDFAHQGLTLAYVYDKGRHPGREELMNAIANNQSFGDKAWLYFWSPEIGTPLAIDHNTSLKHDYLVGVEFAP